MSFLGRRISALVALLFVLLGLPQGVLVVCVAEYGHVALEVAAPWSEEHPDPTPADHASLREAPCACSDPCGPCDDSELGSGEARLAAPHERDVLAPAPQVTGAFALLHPPFVGALPRTGNAGRSPSARPQLQQGVVLRI